MNCYYCKNKLNREPGVTYTITDTIYSYKCLACDTFYSEREGNGSTDVFHWIVFHKTNYLEYYINPKIINIGKAKVYPASSFLGQDIPIRSTIPESILLKYKDPDFLNLSLPQIHAKIDQIINLIAFS